MQFLLSVLAVAVLGHSHAVDSFKKYYECSSKLSHGCPAQRHDTYKSKDDFVANPAAPLSRLFLESHTHSAPSTVRMSRAIKEQIEVMGSVHGGPAAIQKALIDKLPEGETASPSTIPNRRQIANYQARLTGAKLPSPNALANIMTKFRSNNFLRYTELTPNTTIILCHPDAEKLLTDRPTNVFIDGTFEFVEMGLILITFMVECGRVGVPAIFVLTSAKSGDELEELFRVIQGRRVLHNRFNPITVHLDFDTGMSCFVFHVFMSRPRFCVCVHVFVGLFFAFFSFLFSFFLSLFFFFSFSFFLSFVLFFFFFFFFFSFLFFLFYFFILFFFFII
jgi:hypothetical protein